MITKNIFPSINAIQQLVHCVDMPVRDPSNIIGLKNCFMKSNRCYLLDFKAKYDNNVLTVLDNGFITFTFNIGTDKYNISERGALLKVVDIDYLGESEFSIEVSGFTSISASIEDNSWYRCIVPMKKDNWSFRYPTCGWTDENKRRHLYLITLNTPNSVVHVFHTNEFLIIDPQFLLSQKELMNIQYAVSLLFGVTLGSECLDECYILQADSIEFKNILGLRYQRMKESVSSDYCIIPPNIHKIDDELAKDVRTQYARKALLNKQGVLNESLETFFEQTFIDKMFQNFYLYHDVARAAEIMIEASKQPFDYQTALYGVVLETLSTFMEKKLGSIPDQIIESKSVAKKIRVQLLKSGDEIMNQLGIEEKQAELVRNAIKGYNKIPNGKKFKTVFETIGYPVVRHSSDDDAVEQRNLLLHGNLVDGAVGDLTDLNIMFYYALMLHKLCSILLLSLADYEGMILNLPVYLKTDKAIANKEPVLIQIKVSCKNDSKVKKNENLMSRMLDSIIDTLIKLRRKVSS